MGIGKGGLRQRSRSKEGAGECNVAMAVGTWNGEHGWSRVIAVREEDLGRKADGKVVGNQHDDMGYMSERG